MYIFCYALIGIAIVILSKLLLGKILTLPTVFSSLWCLTAILATLNPLDLLVLSSNTHIYIITLVLSFDFWCFFIKAKPSNKQGTFSCDSGFEIRYIVFYLLAMLGIILIMPHLTRVFVETMRTLRFDYSRSYYGDLTSSKQYVYVFLTCNIPNAILECVSMVTALDLVKGRKKLLPITIFFLLLMSFTFGGRSYLLNFIIYCFVGLLYLKGTKKKAFMGILKYLIVMVVVMVLITMIRGGSYSFLEWVTLYFSGSFSLFEFVTQNPGIYGFNDPPLLGYLTFGFVFEPVVLVAKVLFGVDWDVPSYYFNSGAQIFVNISNTGYQLYNNNVTWLFTFMRDFGFFGLVFCASIVSISTNLLIKKYHASGNVGLLMFVCLMFSCVIRSTMSYTLTSVSASLLVLLILFCNRFAFTSADRKTKMLKGKCLSGYSI